jgi:beta-glucosidase-like glycosyl hydrolase
VDGFGPDPRAAVGALLLRAGMTNLFDANPELDPELVAGAQRAVRSGLLDVAMADVDRLVRDWLTYLIRTGVLDGGASPYAVVTPPDGQQLALRAAREQLVLLKNDHHGRASPTGWARTTWTICPGPTSWRGGRSTTVPSSPRTPTVG